MALSITERRAAQPSMEGRREVPFGLLRSTSSDDGPDDGLTLDGYGAVFNRESVIDDYEGRYREKIAPGAMKRSFRETPPKIQFDHGRHPLIGSIPIAALRSVTEDAHPELAPDGGAHIIGRVFDNWLMQPVRDAIASDPPAIDGMSFRFSIVREGWETAAGKPIRDPDELMQILRQTWDGTMPDEELPLRTLKELQVPEMGPVVWPAYPQTSVSMRSKVIDLGRLLDGDPEQRKLFARTAFALDAVQSHEDNQEETAQRSTTTKEVAVGERPAESDDTQRTTPQCVGERPSKPYGRREIDVGLRSVRDMIHDINARKEDQ